MLDVVNVSAISFFWKELKNEITYRILEADIARLGICIRLVPCVCYVGGQDIRRQSSAIPRPGDRADSEDQIVFMSNAGAVSGT
jgi:hypothetical protein